MARTVEPFFLLSLNASVADRAAIEPDSNLVPRGPFCHALEKSGPLANLVPRGPFCHALEKSGPDPRR